MGTRVRNSKIEEAYQTEGHGDGRTAAKEEAKGEQVMVRYLKPFYHKQFPSCVCGILQIMES